MAAAPTDPHVRTRARRLCHLRTLRLLGGVLLLAAAGHGQQAPAPEPAGAGRFHGWDALRDPDFVFDPDERPALGFSVRSTPNGRADLDEAETALAAGDLATAARLLQDAVWLHADSVVQVEADDEQRDQPPRGSGGTRLAPGTGRWAGVGEVALYELLARVPPAARAGLCAPADRRALDEAVAWRDLPRLHELAARLEGLPEGAQAAAAAARLLAERGSRDAARAAADRARLTAPDAALDELAARLAPPPEPPSAEIELPRTLTPLWSEPLLVATLGRPRNPFVTLRDSDEAPVAPVVPVLQDGIAYVADSLSVDAWDVLSGRHLWHHEGPLEAIETQRAWDRFFRFDSYLDGWRQRAVSPWQVAQPTLSDGRLVAVVQAAEPRRELNDFEGIPINYPLPERRLVCLDAADGQRLWSQERPELGTEDFVNRYSVAGAPVVADGAVYTAGYILEGSINAYLAAFDLEDGSLLWRTYVCSGQQDLTMFNRPFMEHTPSPPLLHDGALYACTNLGVTASVDAFSGRVRWVTGYEFMARRASRSPDHDSRRDVRWVNRAPQIAGGSLIVMPLDAQQLLALDPSTGRTRWTMDVVRSDPRTLRFDALALPDGDLAVADDTRIEIVDPATGQSRSSAPLPDDERAYGPLALAGNQVLLPAENALAVLDLRAGPTLRMLPWDDSLKARQDGRHLPLRRRVVAGPRTLLVTDGWDLHAIVDVEALLADALAHVGEGAEARLRAGELLMADGRLAEATAQLDLALADPAAPAALRPELVEARLAVALAVARSSGTRADWLQLLACAARLGQPFAHADEALAALDAQGAQEDVVAALARLATRDPARRMALAGRSGDGALPVGLLAALAEPALESPEHAVERLQGLIESWPDEPWAGSTVRAFAAGRITALLAAHGRAPYARWDARAAAALERAGDELSLQAIEERYPNALAVEKLRLRRFDAWLAEGRAQDVLAALSKPPLGGYGAETTALRARAADAQGEPALAAVLRGAAPEPPPPLPALPGPDARPSAPIPVANIGRIVFPAVTGRFAPEFARCVLGSVDGAGKLFLLDTATGGIRWQLDLPSRLTSASLGYVQLLAAGDRLLAQVYAPGGSSPDASFDQIYAWSLQDTKLLWKVQAPGTAKETVLADGLLLRLDARSDDEGALSYHLMGYGTGTGCTALQLDVPPCNEAHLLLAGGRPVLHTIGGVTRDGVPFDVRLWTVDAAGGRLLGGEPLRGAGPKLLMALDDAPVVLCTIKGEVDGESSLLGWDAGQQRELWRAPAPASFIARQSLYPAGDGRVLLEAGATTGDASAPLRLVPLDARVGPLPPTAYPEPLKAVAGQDRGRVPRLVLGRSDDAARLVVADARTSEHLYDLKLPAPTGPGLRVVHGRDGFALVQDAAGPGTTATLRVIDGATGQERYSGVIEVPRLQKRIEVALGEGALVMASGGTLQVLRSPDP